MPVRIDTAASRMKGQRQPEGAISQALRMWMSAVTRANPLNTASPTVAEWSAENVIMRAATAARAARASCT